MSIHDWIDATANIEYTKEMQGATQKEAEKIMTAELLTFLKTEEWLLYGSKLLEETNRSFVFGETNINLTKGRIFSNDKPILHLLFDGTIVAVTGIGAEERRRKSSTEKICKRLLREKIVNSDYNPVREIRRFLDWLAEQHL